MGERKLSLYYDWWDPQADRVQAASRRRVGGSGVYGTQSLGTYKLERVRSYSIGAPYDCPKTLNLGVISEPARRLINQWGRYIPILF